MKFRLNVGVKFKKFKHIQKDEKRVLLSTVYHELDDDKKAVLSKWSIVNVKVTLEYGNYHLHEIMDLILPEGAPRVTGFNTIGHILQLNLKEPHYPHRHLIGAILLDHVPQARTVVVKSDTLGAESKCENKFRILPMEIVAGEENLKTVHNEHGNGFEFDLGETYWNSRLQEEHKIMANLIQPSSFVIDLCCGIGPFVMPIAKRGIDLLANDLNPDSIKWLKVNLKRNLKQSDDFKSKVALGKAGKTKFGHVEVANQDGHDIIRSRLVELIKERPGQRIEMVMNLPGGALFFLPTFRGNSTWLHNPCVT